MAKVWNVDNRIKFDPADVKEWLIRDPGSTDHHRKGATLTQWQVCGVRSGTEAIRISGSIVYVGYYDSEQEAIDAVDELDAMKRVALLVLDGKLIEWDGTDAWKDAEPIQDEESE